MCAFDQSSRLGKGQTSHAPERLLSAAAYVGDVSVVESLLAQGVDVNAGSNVFGKPLFAAASASHLDIDRLLLAEVRTLTVVPIPERRTMNGS